MDNKDDGLRQGLLDLVDRAAPVTPEEAVDRARSRRTPFAPAPRLHRSGWWAGRSALVVRLAVVACVLASVGAIVAVRLTGNRASTATTVAGNKPVTSTTHPQNVTTTTPGPTPTTSPHTSTSVTTTIPFTSTTTPPTTVPPSTSTTTTTTTIPFGTSFSKTLIDTVAPASLNSETWKVPSGKTFEVSGLSVRSLGSGVKGDVRVELLPAGQAPRTLFVTSLAPIASKKFNAVFTTPLVLPAGLTIGISVSCDANQAACQASLKLSGDLFIGTAGKGDYSNGLVVITPPGTLTSTTWVVPASDSFSLTDLVLSGTGGLKGEVRIDLAAPGAPPNVLLQTTLAQLGAKGGVDTQLATPIVAPAHDALSITVSCNVNQPACSAALLFSGVLSASS